MMIRNEGRPGLPEAATMRERGPRGIDRGAQCAERRAVQHLVLIHVDQSGAGSF